MVDLGLKQKQADVRGQGAGRGQESSLGGPGLAGNQLRPARAAGSSSRGLRSPG